MKSSDSTDIKATIKHVLYKRGKLIIGFFFLCQLVTIYGLYYALLVTPRPLGTLVVMVTTQEESRSINPISLKAPKGTFFTLFKILVYDKKIRRNVSNLTLLYSSDSEFKWFADHAIIAIYISLLTEKRSNYFFYNMTLKNYINNFTKIKSSVLSSSRYMTIDGWLSGWVNDSSFEDRNVTEVVSRFIEVDFVLNALMWRDTSDALDEISWWIYQFAVIDVLIVLAFVFRKHIKKFLSKPSKDIWLIR